MHMPRRWLDKPVVGHQRTWCGVWNWQVPLCYELSYHRDSFNVNVSMVTSSLAIPALGHFTCTIVMLAQSDSRNIHIAQSPKIFILIQSIIANFSYN
ncbi:hypothetical protein V6N13_015856 [Hibiscus sabdariffa]|uniref:Uncharacterized protein n=1 Tax=Hibiscus sabdariffa TaxID=183260 RepID=A0ABR2CWX9_9ROSI